MRVLVTGAAGFVGSHLCEELIAQGHSVVGLDAFVPYYPRAIKERNLDALRRHSRFTFYERDLRTDALDECLEDVSAVVHEAAMAGLPRSWIEFDSYMTCNLLAVQRLLDACRANAVEKLVHISTSSVYGAEAVGDETLLMRPISPYGVTKLAAEHLILAYVAAFKFPATILRYFSIYGPRQRPDMAYHIFIDAMLEGRPITIYGDGKQSRSNTFVSDCVRGTIQALMGAEIGEVYNIGGGEVIILRDALRLIAEELGIEPIINYAPARKGDQQFTMADTAKAWRTFGYQATVAPAEGLHAQVTWQKQLREARIAHSTSK